MLPLDLERKH